MWMTINMATSMKCSVHALPIGTQTPKSTVHTLHLKWFATPALGLQGHICYTACSHVIGSWFLVLGPEIGRRQMIAQQKSTKR